MGAGDQRRPGQPRLPRGWAGSEERARVGDAGAFHERAFSLCGVSGSSAEPSGRRQPLRSLLHAEEQNGLGGGLRSHGVPDFLCKLWGNPFITPEV